MDELAALLRTLMLEHWATTLAEEELTLPLLCSMGASLLPNVLELDDSRPADARRLAEAIQSGPLLPTAAASQPASSSAGAASDDVPPAVCEEGWTAKIAALQNAYFADDLFPPPGAEAWSDAALHDYFESGGTVRPPPSGPAVVGVLRIKWNAAELAFPFDSHSTVGDLRAWVEVQTGIPPSRQKLLGLGSPVRPPPPEERLSALHPPGTKRVVMLIGTRPAEVEAAALDLERGRRAAIEIRNDLNDVVGRRAAAGGRRRPLRPADDQRPIEAQRGAGIFLDPAVWAPSVAENTRGPAYAGTPEERYVRNPRTGRLEQLSLANAFLGGDTVAAGQQIETPFRPEQAAPNVDLIGIVRDTYKY